MLSFIVITPTFVAFKGDYRLMLIDRRVEKLITPFG
jgi:hypothetical protein